MAKNAGAVLHALMRGRRSIEGSAQSAARKIEREFRGVVSTAYPPASVPGEPPHLRTGHYRDSIRAKATGTNGYAARIRIESDDMVAVWTEFGTHRDGRPYMLPRPHWRTELPGIVRAHFPHHVANGIEQAERRI